MNGANPRSSPEWIVIKQQIVTTDEDWRTVYYWDGRRFPTKAEAVSAGFVAFECDDFNVGQVEGKRLVWFGWMGIEHKTDRATVARQLYLDVDEEKPKERPAARDEHGRWNEHHDKIEMIVFGDGPTPYEATYWMNTDNIEEAERFRALNPKTRHYGIARRVITYGPWEILQPNTKLDWKSE